MLTPIRVAINDDQSVLSISSKLRNYQHILGFDELDMQEVVRQGSADKTLKLRINQNSPISQHVVYFLGENKLPPGENKHFFTDSALALHININKQEQTCDFFYRASYRENREREKLSLEYQCVF